MRLRMWKFLVQNPARLCFSTLPPLERQSWPEHRINESEAIKKRWPSPSSHLLEHRGPEKQWSSLDPEIVAAIEIIQMVWITAESLCKVAHYYPDLNIHGIRSSVTWMFAGVFETLVSEEHIWVNRGCIINLLHVLKSEPIYFSKIKIF